jgi:hypothetical protein
LASNQNQPFGIAVDATSVYWVNYGNGDGEVMKAALDGSALTTLASGQQGPYHLAIDSDSVYWADYGGDKVKKLTPK